MGTLIALFGFNLMCKVPNILKVKNYGLMPTTTFTSESLGFFRGSSFLRWVFTLVLSKWSNKRDQFRKILNRTLRCFIFHNRRPEDGSVSPWVGDLTAESVKLCNGSEDLFRRASRGTPLFSLNLRLLRLILWDPSPPSARNELLRDRIQRDN